MIMPANYSAIAENELNYIGGGYVDPMTSVKTLEKNIVEYIGGLYAGRVMNAFIGQWFTNDGEDSIFGNVFGSIGSLFTGKGNVGGLVNTEAQHGTAGKIFAGLRNTIGVLGAIYVLGMNDDAVKTDSVGTKLNPWEVTKYAKA